MKVTMNAITKRATRAAVFVLGLVIAAMAAPSTARVTNGPHPDQGERREVLLNGLPIICRSTTGDRVAVVLIVRAGAMFDPVGKSGLAALTARLLLKGAGSYSADRIASELVDAQATITIEPKWDGVWFTGEAPATNLSTLLDIFSLMVTTPRFDDATFEAARADAIAASTRRTSTPDEIGEIVLSRALYGRHTYGRSIDGDAATLATIKVGDIRYFFSKFYGAGPSVLAVVSPQPFEEVLRLAKPRFGRWGQGKTIPATFLPPDPITTTRVLVVDWPGESTAFVDAGFVTAGRKDAALVGYPLLATLIVKASLLRLPEGAHPAVAWDLRILQSPLAVSYRVPPSDVATSISALQDALRDLQKAPATAGVQSPTSVRLGLAGDATVVATRAYYESQRLVVEPAPPPDVAAAARSVLKPDALTVVVVGAAKEIVEPLKAKGYAVEVVPKP